MPKRPPKKNVLIVVQGGIATDYSDESGVDVRIVGRDCHSLDEMRVELPRAFAGLVRLANLKEGEHFEFEKD